MLDGAGLDQMGVGAVGKGGRKAEVAQAQEKVAWMGPREAQAGMEDFHASEEQGLAGERGEAFDELADEQQGQPRREERAAGQPAVESLAVEVGGDEIVGPFILAAVADAEEVAVAQGNGALEELLKAGGIAGALGAGDGNVQFDEAPLLVVEGEAGDFVGAAPHFHRGPLAVLADGVVAEGLEGHGEGGR